MIGSVLVVCVGNICRSPAGERVLAALCPDLAVSSAGLAALVGHPADAAVVAEAQKAGVSLAGHAARQFTREIGLAHDLILVMEPGHAAEIARLAPELTGRTMLFARWDGDQPIADPYRKSPEFHAATFAQVTSAARAWGTRLGGISP